VQPLSLSTTWGVAHLLDRVARDLSNRRSVVVLLPGGVEPETLRRPLEDWLGRHGFAYSALPLTHLDNRPSPVEAVGHWLAVQWEPPSAPRTVANLMLCAEMPNVLFLDEIELLDTAIRQKWMQLVAHWATTVHHLTDESKLAIPTSLCLIVPDRVVRTLLPAQELFLALHTWWGFPSVLETRLFCRSLNGDNTSNTSERWKESLLPPLCGHDWLLVEYLWDKTHLDVELMIESLREYAARRQWSVETLQAAAAMEFLVARTGGDGCTSGSPPARWLHLWQMGVLYWTPEYGIELHTAALAALGEHHQIRHRLWRGQAELVLPALDGLRLRVCQRLMERYGENWQTRLVDADRQPDREDATTDSLAIEWGRLEWLMRNCSALRAEGRMLPLVAKARFIRNEIAHYKPITFSDYEDLWRHLDRAGIVLR
jgi:hypothetical protein